MAVVSRIAKQIRGALASLVLLVALVTAGSTTVSASACTTSQERGIVDAILNQHYDHSDAIDALIADLDVHQAIIPYPNFYRGLATWYRGYQNETPSLKKKGIQLLQKVIQLAESKLVSDTSENHLIIGIIKAYTARALFENEQIVKGYYTGIDAVSHLDQFLAAATPDTPGYHDAQFLMSLYSVYTHDLKTRTHWLIGTVESVGNKTQSIRNIHTTIESNAVFASEAVRSFLSEVNWRTPDICDYRNLARHTATVLPNNLDLALLAQGIFLKCGQPQVALQINNQYHSGSVLPAPTQEKLHKARLRIYADLGDVQAINQLTLKPAIKSHQILALANAMDVSNSRTEAIRHYQTLKEAEAVAEEIKRAATVRLTYPYRPPRLIETQREHSDLRVCQN